MMRSVGLFLIASLFSCNLIFAQEERDSFDLAEEFNHYYYDFFVHTNQDVDGVTIKPLTHDLIWSTSGGPKKHEQNLLRRRFDEMEVLSSEQVDSASFRIDKEDELRDYLYEHFLFNSRVASITFDGKAHKVVIYEVER